MGCGQLRKHLFFLTLSFSSRCQSKLILLYFISIRSSSEIMYGIKRPMMDENATITPLEKWPVYILHFVYILSTCLHLVATVEQDIYYYGIKRPGSRSLRSFNGHELDHDHLLVF